MDERDPFVIGLEWEMAKLNLNKKQSAEKCGLKYHTFMKVIRTNGRGRDKTKNQIAAAFGYGSWADLYRLGQKFGQTDQNENHQIKEVLKEMGDGDLRILIGRLIEKVDRIERYIFGHDDPFGQRAMDKK